MSIKSPWTSNILTSFWVTLIADHKKWYFYQNCARILIRAQNHSDLVLDYLNETLLAKSTPLHLKTVLKVDTIENGMANLFVIFLNYSIWISECFLTRPQLVLLNSFHEIYTTGRRVWFKSNNPGLDLCLIGLSFLYFANQHPCISGLQRGWISYRMTRQV